jgi:hypothetical protein
MAALRRNPPRLADLTEERPDIVNEQVGRFRRREVTATFEV